MSNNLLISLYDRTGNWSRPYRENGWEVVQVDIQLGQDILTWDYRQFDNRGKVIVLAAQPCDDYAVSGSRWFAEKDKNGTTEQSNKLVQRTSEIINYFNPFAWALENPKTRIHKLNPWLGQRPKYIFNPCDHAAFLQQNREHERYNKETWLFGKFNDPIRSYLPPVEKDSPIWKNFGGKSLATKNARSVTPEGFAWAFYYANH
jgi:hypothetical protein